MERPCIFTVRIGARAAGACCAALVAVALLATGGARAAWAEPGVRDGVARVRVAQADKQESKEKSAAKPKSVGASTRAGTPPSPGTVDAVAKGRATPSARGTQPGGDSMELSGSSRDALTRAMDSRSPTQNTMNNVMKRNNDAAAGAVKSLK